jgi:hypothetical protein
VLFLSGDRGIFDVHLFLSRFLGNSRQVSESITS